MHNCGACSSWLVWPTRHHSAPPMTHIFAYFLISREAAETGLPWWWRPESQRFELHHGSSPNGDLYTVYVCYLHYQVSLLNLWLCHTHRIWENERKLNSICFFFFLNLPCDHKGHSTLYICHFVVTNQCRILYSTYNSLELDSKIIRIVWHLFALFREFRL